MIDFEAETPVPYSEAEQTGENNGHILRVIRIKEVTEHGAVIDPNKSEVEHTHTLCGSFEISNIQIVEFESFCNKGRRGFFEETWLAHFCMY